MHVPARAGRLRNRRFVLFAAETSFTVAVVVKVNFVGLLCRVFTRILGRFLFLPHFDVICDVLLNRRTATWNLFVNLIIRDHLLNSISMHLRETKSNKSVKMRDYSKFSADCFVRDL